MKAIVQERFGQPEVLRFRDIDEPVAGPGQVLVRVRAAGVDPGQWYYLTGLPYLLRPMIFGVRRPRVRVRGLDVAGEVVAVGAGVTAFGPGDAVYGTCDGSFAEYAATRADRLAAKPAGLTFEQAAAVPVSGVTALQGLRDRGRLRAGQEVLITGAGGGVGTFAVQLARALGARVTGVCGAAKADLVSSLGADEVVDRGAGLPRGRYDLILDTVGDRPLGALRRALTRSGTLVVVGVSASAGRWTGGAGRMLRAPLLSPFVRPRLTTLASTTRAADLDALRTFIDAGTVTPVIDRTYPLAAAADALRHLHTHHPAGKLVIAV